MRTKRLLMLLVTVALIGSYFTFLHSRLAQAGGKVMSPVETAQIPPLSTPVPTAFIPPVETPAPPAFIPPLNTPTPPTQIPSSSTPTEVIAVAYQPFEGGFMLYFTDSGTIGAFYANGSADLFDTSAYGNLPANPVIMQAPMGFHRPILGFGKVWGHFPPVRDQLGWATASEKTYYTAVRALAPEAGLLRVRLGLPDGRQLELATGRGSSWQVID
jgi:hypothetical protein